MKKLIYLSLMLCIAVISACDKKEEVALGNIHGLVTDYDNANTPIAGASVTLSYKGLTKTTGSDGRFEFTNVEPGTYSIQVMASNYQTTTKQVTIYADQYNIVDVQLSKSAVSLSSANVSLNSGITQASITIQNNTNNQMSYSFSSIPSYITLSSTSGVVAAKSNKGIIFTLTSRPTQSVNAQMELTVGTESYVINIYVEGTNGGGNGNDGGNNGGNEGNGGGTTTSDVTRGLQACYTFNDDNANNTYGSSHNGTVQGNSSYITDTPDGTGKALSLGSKSYVLIPGNMLDGLNAFSISMWVKDFGTGALFTTTFNDDWFNGAPRLFVNGSNTFVADGCREIFSSSVSLGISATNYQSSGWHMLTATYGNRKINFYIDGSLVNSVSHDNNTQGYGSVMTIGGHANDWWNSSMKVDNVRIYDVVLTAAEVQNIYNYER